MLPLRNRNFEYRHLSVATFLAFISGNFQRICKERQAIPILSQIEGQAIRITASGRVSETRLNVSQTCARVGKFVGYLRLCSVVIRCLPRIYVATWKSLSNWNCPWSCVYLCTILWRSDSLKWHFDPHREDEAICLKYEPEYYSDSVSSILTNLWKLPLINAKKVATDKWRYLKFLFPSGNISLGQLIGLTWPSWLFVWWNDTKTKFSFGEWGVTSAYTLALLW